MQKTSTREKRFLDLTKAQPLSPSQSITETNAEPAFELTVFIGRFQPFHNGHLAVIRKGLAVSHAMCVLVGSSNEPRSHRNPWTFEERKAMILSSLTEDEAERVIVMPLEDSAYNDTQWLLDVQKAVMDVRRELRIEDESKVALIGHSKDHTSFYLKLFPQWGNIDVRNHRLISATPIREAYFSNICEMWLNDCDGHLIGDLPQDKLVPSPVRDFLLKFRDTDAYKTIREEYEHVQHYKAQWKSAPYAPVFVTVDAVVVQSGSILLVKRRAAPGRGLWALPGGFLNPNERIEDGMIRELREETQIKVPEPALRGSIRANRVFDEPNRSSRGRTITHAFLIHLRPEEDLPRIKGQKARNAEVEGADDAEKAEWVPLADVRRDMMFEDHFSIIKNLTALI